MSDVDLTVPDLLRRLAAVTEERDRWRADCEAVSRERAANWKARADAFEAAHAEAVEYVKACRIGWMDRGHILAVAADLAKRYAVSGSTEAKQEAPKQETAKGIGAPGCCHYWGDRYCVLQAGHSGTEHVFLTEDGFRLSCDMPRSDFVPASGRVGCVEVVAD